MSSHSNPQNSDLGVPSVLNTTLTSIISGALTTAITGMVNYYLVKPAVQKGVDMIVPREPIELTNIVDIDDEIIDAEENADDTE